MTGHRPPGFLILFEGRTGSTYVVERLASHPHVECAGEWIELRGGGSAATQRAFTDAYYRRRRSRRVRAVGMKSKFRHILDPEAMRTVLAGNGVRIIHLTRRNLVKWTISGLASMRLHQRLGRSNIRSEDERLEPFAIAPDSFAHALEVRRGWQATLDAFLSTLPAPPPRFEYEDMLADDERFFAALHAAIGVEHRPTASRLIKATPRDVGQLITNLDELRTGYVGTEYEAMFAPDA